jgi:predicted protein tyrosine phosphatase
MGVASYCFCPQLFKITDSIAVDGIGESNYPATALQDGYLDKSEYWVVDVRDMKDESQPEEVYERKIEYAIDCLNKHNKIVICCGAGQSRSPAIAIGVLLKRYYMNFYDAFDLVKEKVPNAEIEPIHLAKLRKIFSVGPD